MAKRFTDTEKFIDPWYRRLSTKNKLLWDWLLCNCDMAGVITIDLEFVEMVLKETFEDDVLQRYFSDRLIPVAPAKYFIPKFLTFQYGVLRTTNPVHVGVMRTLDNHGIPYDFETEPSTSPRAILSRLSKKAKSEIMTGDFFKCSYCGQPGDNSTLTVDHIIPRAKGGDNSHGNLTTACLMCNSKKSDLEVNEFITKNFLESKISENLKSKIRTLNTSFKILNTPQDKEEEKDKSKDKVKDCIRDLENSDAKKILPQVESEENLKRFTPDHFVDLWNEYFGERLKRINSIGGGKHRDNFLKSLEFLPTEKHWRDLFDQCLNSPKVMGQNDIGWTVTPTWIVDFDNAIKVINGDFDDAKHIKNLFASMPQTGEAV
jgi:hypothetical protein